MAGRLLYGQDGQRSNKYTQSSETLYFNKMWTLHTDSGNSVYGGQSAKNIYLGETRIVTKLNSGTNPTYQEEYYKQYFYHSDHLGSASLISDYKGDEYQRIEYTPYGETWVEKTANTGLEFLPYKFTAKELDEETGLYYYGARYLDPKYSRWLSTDPALGEYIPLTLVNEESRKHNQNLPGLGGVFNTVNSNLYHYAGNNPVKYTDPDGREVGCFNYDKYIKNLIIGEIYGVIADFQNTFGKFMNGIQSLFTTKPEVVPVGEASFSIGNFSITGTVSYEDGKIIFSSTPGADVLLAKLNKFSNILVSVDTGSVSLSGDVSIPTQVIVDVKLNTGVQVNKDGSLTITMKIGVGKDVKAVDANISAGAILKLGWNCQNGSFGTAENKKNESLNQNIRMYNYSKSFEAMENSWE